MPADKTTKNEPFPGKEKKILKRKNALPQGSGGFSSLRILIAAASLFVCWVLFPAVSGAINASGTSSTYLLSKENDNKSKSLPLFEYLDFSVQNISDSAFSANFGGWGRYDLQGELFDRKSNSDVQYGYVSFKSKTPTAWPIWAG